MNRQDLWLFQSGFKLTREQMYAAKNSLKEQIRELELQIQKHKSGIKDLKQRIRKDKKHAADTRAGKPTACSRDDKPAK